MRIYPVIKKVISGGSGPPIEDAFSLTITVGDTSASPSDNAQFGFTFSESSVAPTDTTTLSIKGLGDINVTPTDALSQLKLGVADANLMLTDIDTYLINLLHSDTNITPSELVQLKFPAPDFADTTAAPTDARASQVNFWLNGSTGTSNVTNPTFADGVNDTSLSSQQTAALGATTSRLTSLVGNNIAAGVTFTTAKYRGWYKLVTVIATSTAEVVLHSSSALFTDKVMDTLSATNGTTDHTSGDFVYDLVANGVDTLAKLQSCQVFHTTVDALAGVTPAVVTVDAGRIEFTGVL